MTRTSGKILSLAVAAVFATALFLTANARSSAHPSYASLPTLRYTHFGENKGRLARTLDPALASLATDADTIQMVYGPGLVYIGTDNQVHRGIAGAITVSPNRKVYTFDINRKARYANGHYVTAADIKYAVERSLAKSTASDVATTYLFMLKNAIPYSQGKASSVTGVRVLGTRRVQFILTKPYAFFLKALTYSTAFPLDRKLLRGKTAAATGNFLTSTCPGNQGSGPFTFQCFGTGFYPSGQSPSYTLVPNRYYFGPKPKIKVVMRAYDSRDTWYKAYKSGQEDLTSIPTGFIAREKRSKGYHEWQSSRVYYFSLNFHTAPFNDRNCRLAFAYSINRAAIASKILHSDTRPIYDIVPKGFLGYYSGSDSPHYNVKKAKSLLSKCRSRSTPVKLVYDSSSSDNDNQYNEVAAEARAVGFNMTTNGMAHNDWGNIVSTRFDQTKTQAAQNGWQQDYPDPQDYVSLLLNCSSDYDVSQYCSKKFDRLTASADVESNPKTRARLYIQAQKVAIHDGAWITYENRIGRFVEHPYVHGMMGTIAYADPMPVGMDWSKVRVGRH